MNNENFNWKNPTNLIKWLENEIELAQKELDVYMQSKHEREINIFPLRAIFIAGQKIDYPIVIKLTNEDITNLSFLCNINKNISSRHIFEIIKLIKEVDFFNKSKLSIDGTRYKSEITKLKNNADELQKFSESQIIIKLPILPHESIAFTVENLRIYGLDNDEIKSLINSFEIFKTRDKLPKITEALVEREIKRLTINSKEEIELEQEYKDVAFKKISELEYGDKRSSEYLSKRYYLMKKAHFETYYYKAKVIS
jgi:hypothetical protein